MSELDSDHNKIDRRRGPRERRFHAAGSGVLEFALACLLVALIIAGVSVTFALTNRVDLETVEGLVHDIEDVQAEQQEGRRIGIAGICSIEKALIEEGGNVIFKASGGGDLGRRRALSYKHNVVKRARQQAKKLGADDLPELDEITGTIDCQAFAARAKADKASRDMTPTPTP